MRDHIICILRDIRSVQDKYEGFHLELVNNIEVNAMAALHGGATIIPSKLFGEITIPQNLITYMSNGEDDLWFGHGCALDINIFHDKEWQFAIYPINHEGTDTNHLIEKGKL